jgi:hypothetical protein
MKLIKVMKIIPAKEIDDNIINYAKRNRIFRKDFFEKFG